MNNQNKKNMDMSRKFLALSEALEIVNKELFNKTKMKKVAGFSLTEDKQKSLLAEKQALKNLIDQSNFDDNLKALLATQITDLNIPTAMPVPISASPILPTATETMETPKENPVETIKEEKKQEDVLLDEFEQKPPSISDELNELYENEDRITELINYINNSPLTADAHTDLTLITYQLEDQYDSLTSPKAIENVDYILEQLSDKMEIIIEALSTTGVEEQKQELVPQAQPEQVEKRLEKIKGVQEGKQEELQEGKQEEQAPPQKVTKGDLERELSTLYGKSSYYGNMKKQDLNHLLKALPNIAEDETQGYIYDRYKERKQARDENRPAVYPSLSGEGMKNKGKARKSKKGQKLKKMNNRNDYKLDKKKSHLYIGSMIAGNDNKKVKRKLKK